MTASSYRSIMLATWVVAMLVPALAQSALAQSSDDNPYLQPDETWISLSGTAVDIQEDHFTLDYGEGVVLVEMDDWNWYPDTTGLLDGDRVRVYGKVDDDLYETTSIEASSVYVENLGTYFYANPADEEYDEDYDYWVVATPIILGEMTVRGTVTSIDGREFTIDTGTRELTVDTIGMNYNPLDDKGFQKIDIGDYVSVTGEIDVDVWEARELMADVIVTLEEDRSSETSS